MRKILFVANVAKEHIIKFHLPTIRVFKEQGWQVDVACSGTDSIPLCDHQFVMPWKRRPFTLGTIKGIIELRRILSRSHYDVVYCHTPVGGLVARLASKPIRKKGTRVIYCAHGLHFYKGAPLINWILYYPVERILAKYTDLIFTINSEDTDLIKKKFRKGIELHQLPGIGVDFRRLNVESVKKERNLIRDEYHIPQSAYVLIYIAEIINNKNQKLLVDTLRLLRNDNQDVYLLLLGPIHDKGKLKAYVDAVSLSEYVIFAGWRDDVASFLYASDLCAASSIREGFGINLIEAMYCGLPVIATNNRGHRSIIVNGENGLLVPFSAQNMAECVLQIKHDSALAKKLINLDVSKYACENVANEVFNVITRAF